MQTKKSGGVRAVAVAGVYSLVDVFQNSKLAARSTRVQLGRIYLHGASLPEGENSDHISSTNDHDLTRANEILRVCMHAIIEPPKMPRYAFRKREQTR